MAELTGSSFLTQEYKNLIPWYKYLNSGSDYSEK